MPFETGKQRRQRLRDERRAQEEADFYARREEELQKQDSCSHYQCDVTEWTWEGKPREVVCRDCGATNFIEDDV